MELAATIDRELLLRQGQLAYVYAATGDTLQARAVLTRMQKSGALESAHAVAFAIPYMWLGDPTRALSLLERAEEANDVGLLTAASPIDDPLYAPIRNDPRFLNIMQRMGLARFIR
jgi:hypothetical protein